MDITKEIRLVKIHINEQFEMRCEYARIYKKNGIEISRGKGFEEIKPIDDVSQKHDKIKKVSKAIHTKKVKDNYKKLRKIK